MPSHFCFESLPTELQIAIYHFSPFQTQIQLSSVNKACRQSFGTELFQSIKITTESWPDESFIEKHQSTIYHLTLEAQGELEADHVPLGDSDGTMRELIDQHSNRENVEEGTGTPPLAQAVRDLLAGGNLPKLRSVHLSFASFDFGWYVGHPNNGFYIFDEIEAGEDTLLAEDFLGWRALTRDIWAALSRNHTVDELTVTAFVPKPVSTYETQQFKDFLGRLKALRFASIHAADNGAGWKSQTIYGYCHFLHQLGSVFYQHAKRLQSLRVVASSEGNIGAGVLEEYSRHAPHSMLPSHMTQLQHFEMDACFIDDKLADFLAHRSKTLRTVKLRNCSAPGSATEPYAWHRLFEAIALSEPEALTTVDVNNDLIPHGDSGYERAPVFALETVKKFLAQHDASFDPNSVFLYSNNDDKYGDTWLDEELTRESFESGEDQQKFNELMEIVRRNVQRASEL